MRRRRYAKSYGSTAPVGSTWRQHRRSHEANHHMYVLQIKQRKAFWWLMAQPERRALVRFLRKAKTNDFARSLKIQLVERGRLTEKQIAAATRFTSR